MGVMDQAATAYKPLPIISPLTCFTSQEMPICRIGLISVSYAELQQIAALALWGP
jgi:hypothetical protein